MTSSGATPPYTKTTAVSGIEAAIRSHTYTSALSSLPITIAREVMGVTIRSSSVCFSRSRLIAPAVEDGARNATCRVSSINRAAKIPWPMAAVAYEPLPPKPKE
jgi:hypothetical protein